MIVTYQITQSMLYPLIRKYNARKKGNMLENKLSLLINEIPFSNWFNVCLQFHNVSVVVWEIRMHLGYKSAFVITSVAENYQ